MKGNELLDGREAFWMKGGFFDDGRLFDGGLFG
jgi:hypothetical protein